MVRIHGVAHGAGLMASASLGLSPGRSDGGHPDAHDQPRRLSPRRAGAGRELHGRRSCRELYERVDPSHSSGGVVTFAPGARTAWHSHPGGQILIVTAGTGRVQIWGQPIEEIRAGDVVKIPAGVKHWHGGSPNASMTHLGITEQRDGTAVRWMEKVSDEQYNGACRSPRATAAGIATTHPCRAAAPPSDRRQGHCETVGRTPATDRAWIGDAHRRRAVR